jgi:hypothetical protein
MKYTVRNKDGVMIAKLLNSELAKSIMDGSCGFFRNASYEVDGGIENLTIFEITSDVKIGVYGITLFIWKGYKLIPDNS